MQVPGSRDLQTAGRLKTFAVAARPVEKSSAASHLGKEQQEAPEKQDRTIPRVQVELVSQSDTQGFDPFRDAPTLLPIFVAQVLGQVMPERRTMVAVETAYGSAAPRQALLVDRKS
jgi:hypothetical protein